MQTCRAAALPPIAIATFVFTAARWAVPSTADNTGTAPRPA